MLSISTSIRTLIRRFAMACSVVLACTFAGLLFTSAPALASGYGEIGSFGPGPAGPSFGVFERPTGVAVEQATGDVYVYDAGESAAGEKGNIYKFSAGGTPEKFSELSSNAIEGVGGSGEGYSEVAIAEEGAASGDIYVANGNEVNVYAAGGKKIGTVVGKDAPCGVAIGPGGDVYVALEAEEAIYRYAPVTDEYVASLPQVESTCSIAVDSAGDVYAAKNTIAGGVTRYAESEFNDEEENEPAAIGAPVDSAGRTVALDPTNGDVYINELSDVAVYTSRLTPVEAFGSLSRSYGVAVDGASGDVYAPKEEEESEVLIYGTASASTEYPLTVKAAGSGSGTVECEVKGSGIHAACASKYDAGTELVLTATPTGSDTFAGWSEACTNTSGPCDLTMSAAESVTATFTASAVTTYPLTVTDTGLGSGTVTCEEEGKGSPGPCAAEYPKGTKL